MPRKSSSPEEKARDVLYGFLLLLNRAPLKRFLKLYWPDGIPTAFVKLDKLEVRTEVETNLGSRVDLMIASQAALLFVEVKIDAVEQLGQYEKYRHFFESQGYIVTAGGLINRIRKARTKDNATFLDALGVKRVSWFDVLDGFGKQFAKTEEFKRFQAALFAINPSIGATRLPGGRNVAFTERTPALLAVRNDIVCHFYADLLPQLTPMEGTVWQYGNSPYCLAFGKAHWREIFKEDWFHRAFVSCERSDSGMQRFKFGVMLWNRTWTKNAEWFLKHRKQLVDYFTRAGFNVGRNAGSSWHRRTAWIPPYDAKGLKYVNASWNREISINGREEAQNEWNSLLARCHKYCNELARVVDELTSVI